MRFVFKLSRKWLQCNNDSVFTVYFLISSSAVQFVH